MSPNRGHKSRPAPRLRPLWSAHQAPPSRCDTGQGWRIGLRRQRFEERHQCPALTLWSWVFRSPAGPGVVFFECIDIAGATARCARHRRNIIPAAVCAPTYNVHPWTCTT